MRLKDIFGLKRRVQEGFISSFKYEDPILFSSDVSNSTLYDLYIRDGIIRANIDYMASSISDVQVYTRGKGGISSPYNYNFNLENILKELLIYGYSIQYNNKQERRLESIKMSDIIELLYDPKTFKVNGFQFPTQKVLFKDYPNLILINATTFNDLVTNKNSILYPLVSMNVVNIKGKNYSYRLIDLMRSVEYATLANMSKFINTRHFVQVKPSTNVQEIKNILNDPNTLASDIVFTNVIEDIKSVSHKVEDVSELMDVIYKLKNVITQNVFSLMLLTNTYTYATSQALKSLVDERINQYKAQINKSLNSIFGEEFIFIERKEFKLEEILSLVEKGIIDKDEARKMLGL